MGLAKPVQPVLQRDYPLARGLVGAWPFYEGLGATLNDLSGNGNHAAMFNGPTWIAGSAGWALSLIGSPQYLQPINTPSLNITGPITMAAWVKTSSGGNNTIIGGYDPNSPNAGYGFLIGFPNVGKAAYWSGANGAWVSANSTVNDGAWHFVAVSEKGGTATFYKDGASDGTVATADPNSYTGLRAIGQSATGSGNAFVGALDGILLYNRALSAAEIAQLYFDSFAIYRPRTRHWRTPFTSGATSYSFPTKSWVWNHQAPTLGLASAAAQKGWVWNHQAPVQQFSIVNISKSWVWNKNTFSLASVSASTQKAIVWVKNTFQVQKSISFSNKSWQWLGQNVTWPFAGTVKRLLMLLGFGS